MTSTTERNTPGEPTRDPFQSMISAYVAYLEHAGLSGSSVAAYRGPVRHFLTWLDRTGTEVDAVDGRVLRQFLGHDCTCLPPPSMNKRSGSLHAGGCVAPISWFARFLEETGQTPVLGELDDNLLLLEAFMEGLAGEGYSPFTLDGFRFGCRHFIVWLHHFRISIRAVDRGVLDRFLGHDCACFLPDAFSADGRTSRAPPRAMPNSRSSRRSCPAVASYRTCFRQPSWPTRVWRRSDPGYASIEASARTAAFGVMPGTFPDCCRTLAMIRPGTTRR